MPTYFCCFCGRANTNAGSSKKHENMCGSNPNPRHYVSHNRGGPKGHTPWNKGLTKETSDIIAKSARDNSMNFSGENASFFGRKHSESTKKKISEKRKRYLEANPDKVPYLLNHYSKGPSYPESYFCGIFETCGISFVQEQRVSVYSLDFAFLDAKIDVEIDGEQHYIDSRIIESDLRRTRFLESRGWHVIRVRWASYRGMDIVEREAYICDLLDKIRKREDS